MESPSRLSRCLHRDRRCVSTCSARTKYCNLADTCFHSALLRNTHTRALLGMSTPYLRMHAQAVMLCRTRVRTDGVALEALDWAMQENVISVKQRNAVVREVARRTGNLQRNKNSSTSAAFSSSPGSFQSLEALFGASAPRLAFAN